MTDNIDIIGWFYMRMPIAGGAIFWPGLLLLGFSVGVIGGFLGMGGAWMVTPGLNILGFPMAFAIGTNMAHIAGKSIRSTMHHSKFGNVDYKLGIIMAGGTIAGIESGALLVMRFERMGLAGSVVRWVHVCFLTIISAILFYDCMKAIQSRRELAGKQRRRKNGITLHIILQKIKLPPVICFKTSGVTCSIWLPVMVSFMTGTLSGFIGIGGGLIRIPVLIYLLGCPTLIAVGTDLFEVMISGLYGAFTYAVKGRVEIMAVFIMLTGTVIGTRIGTIATKYAKGYGKILLGSSVLGCMISIILKQSGFTDLATVLIFGTIFMICLYIMKIMICGVIDEIREKEKQGKI